MKTLYEQFRKCKLALNSDVGDNPLISKKLKVLFHKVYGIDISDESILFKKDIGSIGQELSISYKFEYGSVDVSTQQEQLVVKFYHNDNFKAPFKANRSTISVDHDLNFVRAEYCMYFAFLNSVLHNNGGYGGYNQMKIQRIIDLNGAYNSISFRHSDDADSDLFIDVERSKLDERFFQPNTNLEETFYQLIDFVTEHPHEFYAIFDGYPSFSNCVEHSDAIIDFVNVFVHQYFSDNERLKQNMLLLDMQAI
jgi:hypothetical protein